MKKLSLFIYTETSLHAGMGSTVSVVDLPIQRERTTGYPLVQGSGVKGALRSQAKLEGDEKSVLFGEADNKGESFAGAISVGDARIVLFPVRSLMGVFAYVTCPMVLARVARDVQGFPMLKDVAEGGTALVTKQTQVKASRQVVLEEFSFTAKESASADAIANWLAQNAFPEGEAYDYWRKKVLGSLVILPDDAFADFVQHSTEITTRVRLDKTKKTVETGALWTQESLPADTLLMSVVVAQASRNGKDSDTTEQITQKMQEAFAGGRVQIGGDETTGDGYVALRWNA
jgi:CRISPR-associated protein Cmr4